MDMKDAGKISTSFDVENEVENLRWPVTGLNVAL